MKSEKTHVYSTHIAENDCSRTQKDQSLSVVLFVIDDSKKNACF
jgi:hypothetical protein